MVRLAGEGLRSVGVEPPPLIQERVLYPAHRHLRAGALRGSGLYNDACVVGRVVLYLLLATRPSLCRAPMPQGQPALTFTERGRSIASPVPPSRLLSFPF
jgi:hypothetical protein